jgi:ribosomal protein S18 acetylase RimI-like enzyme
MKSGYIKKTILQWLTTEKLASEKQVLTTDEFGNIVARIIGNYKILIDSEESPTYISLYYKEGDNWRRVGELRASISEMRWEKSDDFEKYYKISLVSVDPEHRRKGFAKLMYDVLINTRGNDIVGMYSYLPDRSNKREIPKIWNKYNSYREGDYEIVKF